MERCIIIQSEPGRLCCVMIVSTVYLVQRSGQTFSHSDGGTDEQSRCYVDIGGQRQHMRGSFML